MSIPVISSVIVCSTWIRAGGNESVDCSSEKRRRRTIDFDKVMSLGIDEELALSK